MIILYFLLSGRAPILNKLLDTIAHFYIKMSFHINVKDSISKYGVIVSFFFFLIISSILRRYLNIGIKNLKRMWKFDY